MCEKLQMISMRDMMTFWMNTVTREEYLEICISEILERLQQH